MQVNVPVRRVRLNPSDFKMRGLTLDCPGCRAIKYGDPPRNHNDECRDRMESALSNSEQGRGRLRQAEEKMAVAVARQIEEQERDNKEQAGSGSSLGVYQEGGSSGSNKRSRDEDNVDTGNSKRW